MRKTDLFSELKILVCQHVQKKVQVSPRSLRPNTLSLLAAACILAIVALAVCHAHDSITCKPLHALGSVLVCPVNFLTIRKWVSLTDDAAVDSSAR